MAESAEVQRLSIRHQAIMDYLIANPTVKLGDVAAHFKMTPAWLSTVIHSDVFQDALRQKQDVVFHETVLPLREKMTLVAHAALDKLAEKLPESNDVRTIAATAESILDRLGFSPKASGVTAPGAPTQVNVQVNVLADEIRTARELAYGRQATPQLARINIDGKEAPIALPAEAFADVGSAGEGLPVPAAAAK